MKPKDKPAAVKSASPKGLFSRDLETRARAHAWQEMWRNNKLLIVLYYLIDISGALIRALLHAMVWVPAIVMWPLLLSSNGLVKPEVLDWLIKVGGGGWDGALLKLVGAVFVISLSVQMLRGSVGVRFRRHLDRHMERSLLWSLVETQLPIAQPRPPSSEQAGSENVPLEEAALDLDVQVSPSENANDLTHQDKHDKPPSHKHRPFDRSV